MKEDSEEKVLISIGIQFQTEGAAKLEARLPKLVPQSGNGKKIGWWLGERE